MSEGEAHRADVFIKEPELDPATREDSPFVCKLSNSQEQWRKKLLEVVHLPEMPPSDAAQLHELPVDNLEVFIPEKGE